jgi:hypothetical protein
MEDRPVAMRLPVLVICPNFVNRKEFLKVGGTVLTEISYRVLVVVVNDVGHYRLHRHYCIQIFKNRPATSRVGSSSVDWNKNFNVRSRAIG